MRGARRVCVLRCTATEAEAGRRLTAGRHRLRGPGPALMERCCRDRNGRCRGLDLHRRQLGLAGSASGRVAGSVRGVGGGWSAFQLAWGAWMPWNRAGFRGWREIRCSPGTGSCPSAFCGQYGLVRKFLAGFGDTHFYILYVLVRKFFADFGHPHLYAFYALIRKFRRLFHHRDHGGWPARLAVPLPDCGYFAAGGVASLVGIAGGVISG